MIQARAQPLNREPMTTIPCSFAAAAIATRPVGVDPRSSAGIAPGLHYRKPESRHPAAGHSHGAGDGARVAVRGGGRVSGWAGLGANAVATVGLTESLLSSGLCVAIGLSMSTTAMVARRIGEKDPEDAAVAGVQAIVLGLRVSLLIGVPCFHLRSAACCN